MRGRPWLRIMLVCCGMILMGFPVWRLTRARTQVIAPDPAMASGQRQLKVTVIFAHAPNSFELTDGKNPLLKGGSPMVEFTGMWSTSLPQEGKDLLLHVQWPPGTPRTAVEIRVEDESGIVTDQTKWGTSKLTELITVPES